MANEPHCLICNSSDLQYSPERSTIRRLKREECEVISGDNGDEDVSNCNYISTPNADGNGDTNLDKQLKAIFILRKIFEVESESLQSFLRHGNPDCWIKICDKCGHEIDKAWSKYQEILRVIKEFATIRNGILKLVRDSNEAVGVGEGATGKKKTRGLRRKDGVGAAVRKIVYERPDNYGSVNVTCSIKNPDLSGIVPKVEAELVCDQDLDCGFGDLNDTEWQVEDCINDDNDNGKGYQDNQEEDPDYDAEKVKKLDKYACSVVGCGKEFSWKQSYVAHMKRHNNKPEYKCDICGKEFHKKQNLEYHLGAHKRNTIPLTRKPRSSLAIAGGTEDSVTDTSGLNCNICGVKCVNEQGLAIHSAKVHQLKKTEKFVCAEKDCGKEFFWRDSWRGHVKRHKTESKFKCDICERVIYDAQSFRNHQQAHKRNTVPLSLDGKALRGRKRKIGPGITTEKGEDDASKVSEDEVIVPKGDSKLVCTLEGCGMVFPSQQRDKYQRHVTTHNKPETQLYCKICDEDFDDSNDYLDHQQAHKQSLEERKVKRFECQVEGCGKVYAILTSLQYHMLWHKNPSRFECGICGRKFFRKHSYEYHMDAHKRKTISTKFNEARKRGRRPTNYVGAQPISNNNRDQLNEILEEEIIPPSERFLDEGHPLSDTEDVTLGFECESCALVFDTELGLKVHVGSKHKEVHGTGKLTCPAVGCSREYEYSQRGLLKQHIASHTKEMRYRCSICQKEFYRKSQFLRHKSTHIQSSRLKFPQKASHSKTVSKPETETGNDQDDGNEESVPKTAIMEPVATEADEGSEKQFLCEFCDTPFTTEGGLLVHIGSIHKAKSSNKFVCPEEGCKKEYGTHQKQLYRQHMAGHKQEKRFRCKLCFREFYMKSSFLYHKQAHKRGSIRLPKTENSAEILESVDNFEAKKQMEKKFVCDLCGKGFVTESSLRAHKRTTKLHLMGDDLEKFKCKYCQKGFVRKQALNYHEKTHEYTGVRPYICEHCGSGFLTPYLLKSHIKRSHTDTGKPPPRPKKEVSKYQCQKCGKRFNRADYLRKHIRFVHDKDFPCFCDVCGKGCISKQHVRLHRRMAHKILEEGVQEYKCGVPGCVRIYFDKERYDRHMRDVHPNGEDSPFTYSCEQCGRGFWHKNRLKEHLERHEKKRRKKGDGGRAEEN